MPPLRMKENEMSNKTETVNPMVITDPDQGRSYTLEFSRKTVTRTEQAGLDVNQLESKAMTMVPIMFWGAFLMHHPYMTREQTDKILFDGLGGLNEAEMAHLGKLYAEAYQTLIASEGENENPRRMAVTF